MSPSDIAAWAAVIDKGGTIAALVAGIALLLAIVLALGRLARWLLQQLLLAKEADRTYRESLITTLQEQLKRQQDLQDRQQDLQEQQQELFAQALRLLEARGARPA